MRVHLPGAWKYGERLEKVLLVGLTDTWALVLNDNRKECLDEATIVIIFFVVMTLLNQLLVAYTNIDFAISRTVLDCVGKHI